MSDCIFCKIISGEIPSRKIFEDEWTFAFMDVANDVDGHILAVPKEHRKNILDCDEETGYILMKLLLTNDKNVRLERENLQQFEARKRAQARRHP